MRTTAAAASPAALFVFLAWRSFLGSARRRLRRLKEPRYLLGMAFAVLYFATVFGRPGRHRGGAALPIPELPPVVFTASSFGLTALALASWLLRAPRAALPLSEAEVQFLFPAPLGRRGVVRYALLRGQLAILFGALVVSLVFRGGRSLSSFVPAWLILAVVNLHAQAIGFTKARWNERPARRRLFVLGALAALGALALATATLLAAFQLVTLPALVARAGEALLFPARVLLTPMLTLRGSAPVWTWLGALAIVVLHFAWVDLGAARYEEATLALAARRAEMRQRQGLALKPLPAETRRASVPFPLAPSGAPEIAILWKNLLSIRRTPMPTQALFAASVLVVLFAASAGTVAVRPDLLLPVQIAVLAALGLGLVMALVSPLVQREDFRTDLLMADVLRTWPVAPARIAAGEIAAPLATSVTRLGAGLLAALALSAGGAAGLRISRTLVAYPGREALVEFARPGSVLPWLAAAAVLVPPLAAILLVLQNAATLAFPAWFPPGPRRTAGPEVTGMRMIAFLGTVILLALALIPPAVAAGLAAFLFRGLGPRFLPALAFVAAVPLAVEAAAGVWLLGELLRRHDPALEAGP